MVCVSRTLESAYTDLLTSYPVLARRCAGHASLLRRMQQPTDYSSIKGCGLFASVSDKICIGARGSQMLGSSGYVQGAISAGGFEEGDQEVVGGRYLAGKNKWFFTPLRVWMSSSFVLSAISDQLGTVLSFSLGCAMPASVLKYHKYMACLAYFYSAPRMFSNLSWMAWYELSVL